MGEEDIDAGAQGVHDAEMFRDRRVSAYKGMGKGGQKLRGDQN